MAQLPENLILRKKAVKTIVKILDNNEYYHYNTLLKGMKELMPFFENPDFEPTYSIKIKKIKEGSKTFYFIYDMYNESLYILRDDKEEFEKELTILMDKIKSTLREELNLPVDKKIYEDTFGLVIYLDKKEKEKFMVIRKGTIELPVQIEKEGKIIVHTTHIMSLIYSHIIKFYSCLNDKVPF